jgi:phosphatidylglycerol lysyltransferase
VAYRVVGSIALTTADPIGAPTRPAAQVVAGFTAFCREHGWTPAFYSVTEHTRDACAELGWYAVQVAEETVLALPGLAFTGKKWQDVRTALNKAAKAGITTEWIAFSHAPLAITDQIRAISEEWVADKGLPEMGFTLGGLAELADYDVRCLIAVDTDRTVHGIISWLPVHRDGTVTGWTLDFMRRRDGGFHGVTEYLIASAALTFQAESAAFLSLSGAPLARLDRGDQPDTVQRLLDVLGHALEPIYGFRSLLAFKAKFQPEYRPLYLAYPDPAALPSIALAITRAYLPHLTARQTARLLTHLRS